MSVEELPVRLAHRVKELNDLPQGLSEMPSIIRVKEWYAQSFEVGVLSISYRSSNASRIRLSPPVLEGHSPIFDFSKHI
jgi:pyruvate dehydrogenase kinase 2/3/4